MTYAGTPYFHPAPSISYSGRSANSSFCLSFWTLASGTLMVYFSIPDISWFLLIGLLALWFEAVGGKLRDSWVSLGCNGKITGKRTRGGGKPGRVVRSKVRIMRNITRGFKLKVLDVVGCSLKAPPHLHLVLPRVPSLPRLRADDVD